MPVISCLKKLGMEHEMYVIQLPMRQCHVFNVKKHVFTVDVGKVARFARLKTRRDFSTYKRNKFTKKIVTFMWYSNNNVPLHV